MKLTILHNYNFYSNTGDTDTLFEDSAIKEYLLNTRFLSNFMDRQVAEESVNSYAVIFLFSGYTKTNCIDALINYITQHNIKKVYFFIEDVFRVYKNENGEWLQTWPLLDHQIEWWIPELDIVCKLMEWTPGVNYEIFHCEWNTHAIATRYNVDIQYLDIFFLLWIESELRFKLANSDEINIASFNFTHKVSCFNHRPDYHRYFMAALLSSEPHALITLNNRYTDIKVNTSRALPIEKFSPPVLEKIRANIEKLDYSCVVRDGSLADLLSKGELDISGVDQIKSIFWIKEAFVNIVTETRYASPTVYISEKSLKPMAVWRPFIMLASPGTLRFLRNLGFKTFHEFWDESYDDIIDNTARFEAVYDIVQSILQKSHAELEEMLHNMLPILDHNKKHLESDFHSIFLEINKQRKIPL